MSTRRAFSISLCAFAGNAPILSFPQPRTGQRRIAYLGATSLAASRELVEALISGLRELGYVDGSNSIFDMRFAEGDLARLHALMEDQVALRPDIMVVSTDTTARPVAAFIKTIPIVFVLGFDPVGLGLVKSLANPGGNATGFSIVDRELAPKRLALLKEAIPKVFRVGVLYRKEDDNSRNAIELEMLEDAGRGMGVSLFPVGVLAAQDIPDAFEKMSAGGVDGLVNISDTLFYLKRQQLADLAIGYRWGWATSVVEYADAGALIAYGPDYPSIFRRSASLIDRVLRGANPGSIPVEQANVYQLVLNTQTARNLRLKLPQSLLLQATRVIE